MLLFSVLNATKLYNSNYMCSLLYTAAGARLSDIYSATMPSNDLFSCIAYSYMYSKSSLLFTTTYKQTIQTYTPQPYNFINTAIFIA